MSIISWDPFWTLPPYHCRYISNGVGLALVIAIAHSILDCRTRAASNVISLLSVFRHETNSVANPAFLVPIVLGSTLPTAGL